MTVLSDLTTPLTVDEIKTAIYDTIAARGVDTTAWKPGSVVRTMIAGVAIVLAAMSALIALIAASGFLALSEGPWLTLVARYVYATERITGTFATGTITIDNASGSIYAIAVGDLVVQNSTTGATYRNTAVINVGSLETGVSAAIQADVIGTDGNAGAGDIDTLVTSYLGLRVTNAAALVGTDDETDPALRTRAAEKTGALSPNGPRDAYSYFAKSAVRAADGVAIGVTRVKVTPDGTGNVTVIVANASGPVTGTSNNPATDLGAVHLAMEENAVPLGITLFTESADALTIAVTGTLWVKETLSLTDTEIEDAVTDRLTAALSTMPIGGVVISPAAGKVYLQAIEAEISEAVTGYLVDLDVTLPAGDITPATDEAPVMGTLTLTIVRVPV